MMGCDYLIAGLISWVIFFLNRRPDEKQIFGF